MQVNSATGINKVNNNQIKMKDISNEDTSLNEIKDSEDNISYSVEDCEEFMSVFNEMQSNVPDCTTTIEEKELAISYIDRMLNCDDITDDLKAYWTDKKNVIEMEIVSIKLMQTQEETDNGEDNDISYKDIKEDYDEFKNKYWNKDKIFRSEEDKAEYWLTYDRTCMAYIEKLLKCNDLDTNMRKIYNAEYIDYESDVEKQLAKLNIQPQ